MNSHFVLFALFVVRGCVAEGEMWKVRGQKVFVSSRRTVGFHGSSAPAGNYIRSLG